MSAQPVRSHSDRSWDADECRRFWNCACTKYQAGGRTLETIAKECGFSYYKLNALKKASMSAIQNHLSSFEFPVGGYLSNETVSLDAFDMDSKSKGSRTTPEELQARRFADACLNQDPPELNHDETGQASRQIPSLSNKRSRTGETCGNAQPVEEHPSTSAEDALGSSQMQGAFDASSNGQHAQNCSGTPEHHSPCQSGVPGPSLIEILKQLHLQDSSILKGAMQAASGMQSKALGALLLANMMKAVTVKDEAKRRMFRSDVNMNLRDLLCVCDFNPHEDSQAHTIIDKAWRSADFESFTEAKKEARRKTQQASVSADPFQVPTALQTIGKIAGMTEQAFNDDVEQVSGEVRSAVVAKQEEYIRKCSEHQSKDSSFSFRDLELYIRSEFQPRWAGKHKPQGLADFQMACPVQTVYQAQFSPAHVGASSTAEDGQWFWPQTRGDDLSMNVKGHIKYEDIYVNVKVYARPDSCSIWGSVLGKNKLEMYDDMSDEYRAPHHAEALCMGAIWEHAMAAKSPWFSGNAASFMAEYLTPATSNEVDLSQVVVQYRSRPFEAAPADQSSPSKGPAVDENSVGRIVVTVYSQIQCQKFWELIKLRAKRFFQVVQCLVHDKALQQSYLEAVDKKVWYESFS